MVAKDFWQQIFVGHHVPAAWSCPSVFWSPLESTPVLATLWQRSSRGKPAFSLTSRSQSNQGPLVIGLGFPVSSTMTYSRRSSRRPARAEHPTTQRVSWPATGCENAILSTSSSSSARRDPPSIAAHSACDFSSALRHSRSVCGRIRLEGAWPLALTRPCHPADVAYRPIVLTAFLYSSIMES